jgi:peptidoglycan/xylan/chitin deacetylase (PgdA/CDA1 family)
MVGLELIDARGRVERREMVAARVKRADRHKLILALIPGEAGLRPHRYDWRVVAGHQGPCVGAFSAEPTEPAASCIRTLPGRGYRVFRLRPVRVIGCTGGNGGPTGNGPRGRPVVALTFDDGPSDYTPRFLDVLREKHAHATFFEIGQEIPGRAATMRRILRDGDEIGNHTMHHGFFPGFSEIAPTSALIESNTHFSPCLFRPPGGGVDEAVLNTAARLGMRTIVWDVDPSDWTNPGSEAVYRRVVSAAQPGSIILMHDGGGNRSGTLVALPRIIDALRSRGYRFATVSALLGQRFLYEPFG